MSLNRYAKNRDTGERGIIDALEAVGAFVFQLDRPVDLLVGYQGSTYLLEVKEPLGVKGGASRDGQHLNDAQYDFFNAWRGGMLAVVRTPDEALQRIGVTNRGVEIGERVKAMGDLGE